MAYLGARPTTNFRVAPTKDTFTGDGSTTTFDLANVVPAGGENALQVFIDNVRQEPGSGKAFTLGVDGSNDLKRITFTAAPAASSDIYVITTFSNEAFANLADYNGTELVLDADGDTSITADTDDQIDIKIAGADDFQFTANTFTAQSGSSIVAPEGGLTLGSTAINSTAAELNLLDGSAKSTSSITVADADALIVIDGTTTKQIPASDIKTYAGFGVSDITGATELAAEPADTDEFVLSDAGTLKRIDYSHIRAGWQLLSTTDVSDGTSTVNMTLTGSYDLYAVTFTNLIPNNDNNTLRHAFSDDDFSSVNQQIYGGFAIHGVTKSAFYTNDNFQSATGYVRIADTVGGNNTYEGVRGIIYYANMRTAAPKGMYWGNIMGYDAAEKAANHTLAGWMDSTNVCTGIAYNYDSGTFKSGQIKLYGLK